MKSTATVPADARGPAAEAPDRQKPPIPAPTPPSPGRSEPRADVAALEELTRALVGITLESLDALGGAVTVAQFRLLRTLDALGRVPSSALAAALEIAASSVTRLVDRLQAAGYVARGSADHNRSVVTVEVTGAGRDLVTVVLERRHDLLRAILDRMSGPQREAAAATALAFTALSGDAPRHGANGPVPL